MDQHAVIRAQVEELALDRADLAAGVGAVEANAVIGAGEIGGHQHVLDAWVEGRQLRGREAKVRRHVPAGSL